MYVNPELSAAAKVCAKREGRTVSGLVGWLLERHLGWDNDEP